MNQMPKVLCSKIFLIFLLPTPLHAFECSLKKPDTNFDATISSCRSEHFDEAKRAIPSYQRAAEEALPKLREGIRKSLEQAPQGANLGVLATSVLNALVPGRFALFNSGGFAGPNQPNAGLIARVSGDEAADSLPARSLLLRPAAVLDPELAPPLAQALRDAGAQEDLQRLEESLDLSDALEVDLVLATLGRDWSFGFGGNGERYGRLFAQIVQGAIGYGEQHARTVFRGVEKRAAKKLAEAENQPCALPGVAQPTQRDLLLAKIKDLPTPCLRMLNEILEDAAVESAAPYRWVIEATGKARLDEFAQLISNTSQLSLRLRHIEADSLVGTSASGLRIDWEISLSPSIESFLSQTLSGLGAKGRNSERTMQSVCAEESVDGATECFDGFLKWQTANDDQESQAAIRHNRRIAVSLEAMRLRPLDASVEVPLLANNSDGDDSGEGGGLLAPLLPPILSPDEGDGGGGGMREVAVSAPAAYRYRLALRAGDTLWSGRQSGLGVMYLRLEAGADYTHFDVEAQGNEVVRQDFWRWYIGPVLQIGRYAFPLTVGGQSRSEFEAAGESVDFGVLGGLQFRFL